MDGRDAARLWLVSRIDQQFADSMRQLLRTITEQLALASSDAVTVRMLSADGDWLLPVSAHHPNPALRDAMAAVMNETAQRSTVGLWRPVLDERRPVRYCTPAGAPPAQASDQQVDFLHRFPIRGVIGVPLLRGDRLVGGVSLVRYVDERAFTDQDEALLIAFADRAALVVDCLRALAELAAPEPVP